MNKTLEFSPKVEEFRGAARQAMLGGDFKTATNTFRRAVSEFNKGEHDLDPLYQAMQASTLLRSVGYASIRHALAVKETWPIDGLALMDACDATRPHVPAPLEEKNFTVDKRRLSAVHGRALSDWSLGGLAHMIVEEDYDHNRGMPYELLGFHIAQDYLRAGKDSAGEARHLFRCAVLESVDPDFPQRLDAAHLLIRSAALAGKTRGRAAVVVKRDAWRTAKTLLYPKREAVIARFEEAP